MSRWRKSKSTPQKLSRSTNAEIVDGSFRLAQLMRILESGRYLMYNFNFKSNAVEDENGLIWKPILRTGNWQYSPGPGGQVKRPFSVVKGNSKDIYSEIGMEDVISSFKEGAVDHVTIPKDHLNKVDENTGYIRDLKIEDDPNRPGESILVAGHEFTEPDIKEKVLRGSIANNSCQIKNGYRDSESGKVYASVLKHSCLTNEPFIHGLASFSEEDGSDTEQIFLDEEITEDDKVSIIDTISEKFDEFKEFLTKNNETSYNSNNEPASEASFSEANLNGGFTNMPKELSELNLSEEVSAEVAAFLADREASIKADAAEAAKNEFEVKLSEAVSNNETLESTLSELRSKERENEVNSYIDELSELGFSESPGFLKEVRAILSADNGETSFDFSENGKGVSFTPTEIVKRVVNALPKTDEGNFSLSEQAKLLPGDERPPANTDEENQKPQVERTAEAEAYLYGTSA